MPSNKPTATPYEVGRNETLDRIIPEGVEVWIVQGRQGRIPVSMKPGSTAEQAVDQYLLLYAKEMTAA